MNDNVTQTIVTGGNPRGLPEFQRHPRGNKQTSHPSQPELN